MRPVSFRWWRRAAATVAVGAMTVLGLSVAIPASAADWSPEIHVFLADGTTPYVDQPVEEGETLVVKGSGFDPNGNVGGYGAPIPKGQPQGTYVVFGSFADNWKPSDGAKSAARQVGDQKWALSAEVLNGIPNDKGYQDAVRDAWAELDADGNFATTLTVSVPPSGGLEGGVWGVYTYGAGGVQSPAQELTVPVNFQPTESDDGDETGTTTPTTMPTETTPTETTPTTSTPTTPPASKPSVTVTPTTIDPSVDTTLTVKGTGFVGAGAANGVYVLFGKTSIWQGRGPLVADGWDVQDWAQPKQMKDGAFTIKLDVPAGTVKPGTDYQVATSAAHGLAFSDRSLDTFTPITVEQSSPAPTTTTSAPTTTTSAATTTTSAPATPTVSIKGGDSANSGVNDKGDVIPGKTITFVASGFAPGEKVSATVHSDPVSLGTRTADAQGTVSFTWTVPEGFAEGAHRLVLQSPSVTSELAFTVAAASAASSTPVVQCTTETVPATPGTPHLSWGIKSSFIGYVLSGVADGTVTPSNGAARSGDGFTWGAGSGTLDGSGQGTLTFPGQVHITGHGGVLNLTLSNLRVKITGSSTGTLVADVQSTDMEGNDVSGNSIALANLSFSSLSEDGGTASATLTGAGAKAFAGFYDAGEALDQLQVSITGAKAATTVERCTDAAGNAVDADGNSVTGLAETGFDTGSMAALSAFLAGAGVLLLLLARRRTAAARMH